MKGKPKIMKDLAEAIGKEQTLHNKYQLSKRQFKLWGIDGKADHLGELQHECHDFVNMLTRRLLFLGEGNFSYQPEPVSMGGDPEVILHELLKMNLEIVSFYEDAVEEADKAKDVGSCKLFAHLAKWHQENYKDGKGDGHVDWLEKQLDQINRIGLKEWIAEHI